MTMNGLQSIPIEKLHEHPENPRKHFDEGHLEDLAASIREHGILTPLLVRPNGGASFQVIGGHRRYRAALRAEVAELPAIVRELDDRTALELLVLDNLQRDDLHPLEEAKGYEALMKQAGYDVQKIAERVSKSTKYVYDRVKLLQLTPEARKIFLDGEITAGHAILLARLNSTDQERAIGSADANTWKLGGLFLPDLGKDDYLELELDEEDDEGLRHHRKAVSVREFESWIAREVRFRPEEVDLPNLFPETAAALEAAEEEELKVIKITSEYRVPDGARDKERTYGFQSWKRADGEPEAENWYGGRKKPSKTCEHSVMGVVVAGAGRGEAFRVCIAKKKCEVHWKEEQKAKAKAAGNGSRSRDDYAAQQQRWEEQRKREEAERVRWVKAAPKLLEALAEKIKAASAEDLIEHIVKEIAPNGAGARDLEKHIQRGTTIEDAIRYCVFMIISDDVTSRWQAPTRAPKALKPFGIDAKKIVNEVAPKEKKARKPKAKKAAPGTGKGARARRRKKSADVSTEAAG